MSAAWVIIPVCLTVLASCATVHNPTYQSSAPEVRGGRATASSIDLVSEVDVVGPGWQHAVIGVFYLRDVFKDGGSQAVLLSLRGVSVFAKRRAGSINDYDLRGAPLLTVDQARQLLDAIDNFLGTDPTSLPPTRMLNYELDSGTVDSREVRDDYRPLREVTFVVAFSVTAAGKSFKTVFPPFAAGVYNPRQTGNPTFELSEQQVRELRDAIASAVDKPAPRVAP